MSESEPESKSPPELSRKNTLHPRGLIYPFVKHVNPEAKLEQEQSDDDLLQIFDTYATETGNADAKTSTSDLDIMRRCYVDTTVKEGSGLYKGHIVDTQTKDDGSSVDVNVLVFIKRVVFAMRDHEYIAACIKREKVDYGKLSEQSTDNEICKLKVTFVLKINPTTVYVFVISEFCEGYTIKDFVMNVFPFVAPVGDADPKTIARKYATKFLIRLAKELLDFILWLHSKRYVYVDIKPENFIVGVIEFPKTEEDWTKVFARQRIIRAIDFGALQEYSKQGSVVLTAPVMHSSIMDLDDTLFFGQVVDSVSSSDWRTSRYLPPFTIRTTDFSNKIKSTDVFPESYSLKLNFLPPMVLPKYIYYPSYSIIELGIKNHRITADQAIYMDVYGAWLLILSLLWYCAPYYNTLLIKFIVLLRGMIAKDDVKVSTIWGNQVNATFCKNHVAPYLLELYTEASNDENLLAIDNTTHDDKITEMKLEFTRLDESLRAIAAEKIELSKRIGDNDREKQKLETDITKNKTEMKNVQTYCEQTGPIYNEIAALFGAGARKIEPVCGGEGGMGRGRVGGMNFKRTIKDKGKCKGKASSTYTSKTRKRRTIKNKKRK